MEHDIERLREILLGSRRAVFFGGAGVSTESGIPDFRSEDGLYHQQYKYPPETILSHTFFMQQPEEFFRFYRAKMICKTAKPNPAHISLAQLEKDGRLAAVVTQNIDGLHTDAGSKTVFELHGCVRRNHCMECGSFFDEDFILNSSGIPRCACGGIVKPDVVLYEEGLDNACVEAAVTAIARADTLLVAGTSLTVYPAAQFTEYFRGEHLVLINRSVTPLDGRAELAIHSSVGKVLREAYGSER